MIERPARPVSALVPALAALVALVAGALGSAPAWGHSFDRGFASARYLERVGGDELYVLVVVEMPTLDVLGDFRRFLRDHPEVSDEENTERFRVQQLQLLADRFTLTLGGEPLEDPWRPVDSPANGLGDADFFVYMIEHRGAAPKADRFELELTNRLQPAKVVYMSSRAEAAEPWRVLSDSAAPILAEGLDGEVVGPDVPAEEAAEASAKWSTREAMRDLRVLFARGGDGRRSAE